MCRRNCSQGFLQQAGVRSTNPKPGVPTKLNGSNLGASDFGDDCSPREVLIKRGDNMIFAERALYEGYERFIVSVLRAKKKLRSWRTNQRNSQTRARSFDGCSSDPRPSLEQLPSLVVYSDLFPHTWDTLRSPYKARCNTVANLKTCT